MGTYDKMAGFNWTVEGISTTLSARYESDCAVTDASGANIAVAVKADAGVNSIRKPAESNSIGRRKCI